MASPDYTRKHGRVAPNTAYTHGHCRRLNARLQQSTSEHRATAYARVPDTPPGALESRVPSRLRGRRKQPLLWPRCHRRPAAVIGCPCQKLITPEITPRRGRIGGPQDSGDRRSTESLGIEARRPRKARPPSQFRSLDGFRLGRIALQRPGTARPMVVRRVPAKKTTSVLLVEHDERIQTFPPDRTNQPLNVRTLPRGPCGGQHLLDVEVVDPVAEAPTIDPLAATVARLSSMPSLPSSFRTRGLPHVGLARDIPRIKSRIAWSSSGGPGLPVRLFRVHKRLNPARCQPMTVASSTIASAFSQPSKTRESVAHSPRSAGPMRSLRLPKVRLRTPTW